MTRPLGLLIWSLWTLAPSPAADFTPPQTQTPGIHQESLARVGVQGPLQTVNHQEILLHLDIMEEGRLKYFRLLDRNSTPGPKTTQESHYSNPKAEPNTPRPPPGPDADAAGKVVTKAQILKKLASHSNLKVWVESLDDVANRSLFRHIDDLPNDSYLGKLNEDIVHLTYGTEIKELITESPEDLTNIWKQLKEDPAYCWELGETGGVRWTKWSKREFFKSVTGKGSYFEKSVCKELYKKRTSAAYLDLKAIVYKEFGRKNLDEYVMFDQLQLRYGTGANDYFIGDQVFIKFNSKNDPIDIIIIENKLSEGTRLTPNQTEGIKRLSFNVRSIDKESITDGVSKVRLDQGVQLAYDGQSVQWLKVHDGDNGDTITGVKKYIPTSDPAKLGTFQSVTP